MQKHFLTIAEFRATFGVGKTKTYELIGSGAIEARKIGSRTMIVAESASRWAAALPPKRPREPRS